MAKGLQTGRSITATKFTLAFIASHSFHAPGPGPQPSQRYTLEDALKLLPLKIKMTFILVLFQAAQHSQIQLHHSTTAAFQFTAQD